MSSKFEQWMRDYIIQHEPGNPQKRLDNLCQAKITHECSHPSCDNPASHEAWGENNIHVYLCQTHFFMDKDAQLLKRWRRL